MNIDRFKELSREYGLELIDKPMTDEEFEYFNNVFRNNKQLEIRARIGEEIIRAISEIGDSGSISFAKLSDGQVLFSWVKGE